MLYLNIEKTEKNPQFGGITVDLKGEIRFLELEEI